MGVCLTPSSYTDLDMQMPSSLPTDENITPIRTRTYSDGCAMIFVHGELVAQGRQFSLDDVEVVTTSITVAQTLSGQTDEVGYDCSMFKDTEPMMGVDLCNGKMENFIPIQHSTIEYQLMPPKQQMAKGSACWLWDYLRRSKAAGFVVPLSGGIDSGCTVTIVYSMCRLVMQALKQGNAQVRIDVRRVVGSTEWLPETPQKLCDRILHTMYMGVSGPSSDKTRSRAHRLAQDIGAHHTDMNIDNAFRAERDLLQQYIGHTPTFESGMVEENLALQNIQARLRMVTTYYFAQLLPRTRGRVEGGTLLVLGSVNVEECLRGSLMKHDCSSVDLSLIRSFSKLQIRDFMSWARTSFDLPILQEFLDATPTAELEPMSYD
jgi:NAD+ synthase (glutamine-hydrolysing)